ncbi:MAG: hypothetical protein QY322_01110 [bacterium]|nr:MAG: hypothetical protein QY322_01110 [bacterium]
MTKNQIIESLYKVMCSSTSSVSDSRVTNNDYFKRRVLGFKAEVEFENLMQSRSDTKFLEGGQLISKKLSGDSRDKNSFIYTTISSDNEIDYVNIYKKMSTWEEIKQLLYIKINLNDWETEQFETKKSKRPERSQDHILKPKFTFYLFNAVSGKFNVIQNGNFDFILNSFSISTQKVRKFPLRKREQFDYFNNYDIKILQKIYATRYFLDVVMRKAQGRQIIDLDGFVFINSNLFLVEIKEKTPISNGTTNLQSWQYGWDSRRILWYLYLLNKINIPIIYNVRQVNNREDRLFVQWDSILLSDFLTGVSWSNSRGGGGGEDTLLAPYTFFIRLENLLSTLLVIDKDG